MTSYAQMIDQITPEIYQNLKRSVELGKWPNGLTLTKEQKENCLQAIIAWEIKNLPENQRTGFIDSSGCKSNHHQVDQEDIIIKSNTN